LTLPPTLKLSDKSIGYSLFLPLYSLVGKTKALLGGANITLKDQGRSRGRPVGGRTFRRNASGIVPIEITPTSANSITTFGYRRAVYSYVEAVLHELIHASDSTDRYTDREVAEAIYKLGNLPKGARREYEKLSANDVEGNSFWFDRVLQTHCPAYKGAPNPQFNK
jgi:hypothetical protein